MAVCELISVGTEILLGDILNTDAQYLSIELAKLGISVIHQSTVGDNRERLLAQLDEAAKRSDIIILSDLSGSGYSLRYESEKIRVCPVCV